MFSFGGAESKEKISFVAKRYKRSLLHHRFTSKLDIESYKHNKPNDRRLYNTYRNNFHLTLKEQLVNDLFAPVFVCEFQSNCDPKQPQKLTKSGAKKEEYSVFKEYTEPTLRWEIAKRSTAITNVSLDKILRQLSEVYKNDQRRTIKGAELITLIRQNRDFDAAVAFHRTYLAYTTIGFAQISDAGVSLTALHNRDVLLSPDDLLVEMSKGDKSLDEINKFIDERMRLGSEYFTKLNQWLDANKQRNEKIMPVSVKSINNTLRVIREYQAIGY